MIEPQVKKASFFIDGQNLFHAARQTFGYTHPNYDVKKLAEKVCELKQWKLSEVHFYTGIPSPQRSRRWHLFWNEKLAMMGRHGIKTFSRSLSYSNGEGREKGIDIRIALDVVRATLRNLCDAAVIFSQDQDLSEVATEVRYIAKMENRWIKIASAFPVSQTSKNKRGINNTDWIKIDRDIYDQCIDKRDYGPKTGAE